MEKNKGIIISIVGFLLIVISIILFSISLRDAKKTTEEVNKYAQTINTEEEPEDSTQEEDLIMANLDYADAAKNLTYIGIQQSNGFDDFIDMYGDLFTNDAVTKIQEKYTSYYEGNKYVITGDDAGVINSEGLYPYYDDDYNILRYVSEEEYINRMTQLTQIKHSFNLDKMLQQEDGFKFEFTIDDSIHTTVKLVVDESGIVTDFCEVGVDLE